MNKGRRARGDTAAKKFIDDELAKYETWDDARVNEFINTLFANAGTFENTKKHGAGQTTILKFLGDNWKQWQIQQALNPIYCKDLH